MKKKQTNFLDYGDLAPFFTRAERAACLRRCQKPNFVRAGVPTPHRRMPTNVSRAGYRGTLCGDRTPTSKYQSRLLYCGDLAPLSFSAERATHLNPSNKPVIVRAGVPTPHRLIPINVSRAGYRGPLCSDHNG